MILPSDHYISVINKIIKLYIYNKLKRLNNEQIARDRCYPNQKKKILDYFSLYLVEKIRIYSRVYRQKIHKEFAVNPCVMEILV